MSGDPTGSPTPTTARPLRALLWPDASAGDGNPFIDQFSASLAATGVTVGSYRGGAMARGGWDVCHIHWPEWGYAADGGPAAAAKSLRFLLAIALGRLRGTRVCWTVHNAAPHDGRHPRLGMLHFRAFARMVDGVILLSRAGEAEVLERYPRLRRRPRAVVRHGDYAASARLAPPRAAARAELGIAPDARVALCFGRVEPYKGIDRLLEAFAGVRSPTAALHVAGRLGDGRLGETLHELAADDPRISLDFGFLSDAALATRISASDLVVLPYQRILNSGSALLALSCGRPVLVPRQPTFEELATEVGHGWVHLYDGPISGAGIEAAVDAGVPANAADLNQRAWPVVAAQTRAFYERLAAGA